MMVYIKCLLRKIPFVKIVVEKISKIKSDIHIYYILKRIGINQKKALKDLQNKKCLKCVFLVTHYQTWKYDYVYKRMEENERFDPIVLICPTINYGHKKMIQHLSEGYNYFNELGYNVLRAYDSFNNIYVDIEKDLHADLIFYTNPYKGLIDNRYFIDRYFNYLTVYVSYNYGNNNDYNTFHNLPMHNYVWRLYAETDEHKKYSELYAKNRGRNVVTTGYPGIEPLLDTSSKPDYHDWKNQDSRIKRIIWAPHHTLEAVGNVSYSCFMRYCDFMLEMADKYSSKVQFVFKPHPLLKDKLDLLWGVEKANAYYEQWVRRSNCSFHDGVYTKLFTSSDAMIHDCGSFLVEYLHLNKPVMRTLNEIPLEQMFNPFALRCLEYYYMAYNEQDVEQFIQNVINGVDPLKEQRTKFVNEVLMPKGSPSQNIIDDILDSIDNQILYRN